MSNLIKHNLIKHILIVHPKLTETNCTWWVDMVSHGSIYLFKMKESFEEKNIIDLA